MVGSHALGRSAAVGAMSLLPHADDVEHAKAKPLATAVPRHAVTVASATVALLVVRWLRKWLGGYTGDTLGATEQMTELAVLRALTCRW